MKSNDGGPAFPMQQHGGKWTDPEDGTVHYQYPATLGMTLRDYFAAAALRAILPIADDADKRRDSGGVQDCAADYAQVAYWVADAMLAARAAAPSPTDLEAQ